ncbi:MAG: thermonuclease family protein [Limisphaerales bacterium]
MAFIDCPKADATEPTRNLEQAEFIGVPVGDIPGWGKLATAKVSELLTTKPFTIKTRWASALGRSRLPRFFATITTADGKDLGETLLSLGLARDHGQPMEPPSREKTDAYKHRLRRLVNVAREAKSGIWGGTLPK